MRIGIFGGSFNPVHEGHLRLALEAVSELNLKKVIFVPARQQPLKKAEVLSSGRRLVSLKKAIARFPFFEISTCELRRGGISYTVDTLRFFKKKFGPQTQLYFLAGGDALKTLSRWKSLRKILGLCRFAVFSRPGFGRTAPSQNILYVPMEAADISSTEIRHRV